MSLHPGDLEEILDILDRGGLLDSAGFAEVAMGRVPALRSKRRAAPAPSLQVREDIDVVVEQEDDALLVRWLSAAHARLQHEPRLAHAMSVIIRRLSGPGAPPPLTTNGSELPQRIVLDDDTVPFVWLDGAVRTGKAVFRVRVPVVRDGKPAGAQSRGTAWLIDPEHVMTCFHVVNARQDGEDAAAAADLAEQVARSVVELDFVTPGSNPPAVDVAELVASDRALDYALLRLKTKITDRDPVVLREAALPAIDGDARAAFLVNIVQHPNGDEKRLAMRNNAVVKIDEKDVVYFTDTNEGASGAPVADDEWRVVALHRSVRFIKGLQYMGRIVGYANAGTRIDVILEHLRAEIAAGRAQSARAIARVGPKDKGSS